MPLRRALPAAALLLATALPAAALDLQALTPEEREAFRAEVRAYLLDNPEVLSEAIAVLDSRQEEQQAEADAALVRDNLQAIAQDGRSWTGGNPDGDVTVVEFMDYRCGYCRRAFEEVEELVATDGNIRFVLKEFPILGPQSELASRFAIAVRQVHGDQAYKDAHDALMLLESDVDEGSLARLAEGLALDPAPLLAAMDSPEVTAVIAANHDLARALGITGTPTFVMGDRMLRGYVPLPAMEAIVAEERAG
ncbi:DsbA family protein [Rubellimicrobium aerolatum]|uniref:DsbA family protein n=1 Tax=Rubellimicrobium aerolatum TaxID=490979 RepID=A0ABW0SCP5_9RHOB|nr:DsbA family protein [Rubellimicrobium aerolatum]MBP1805958.1 protein-disulfide isomerase [Rubellimicrobium aerolatum]